MAFSKQIEILRAYPSVCGAAPRPVKNSEIGPLVELAPETVGFANPFFVAIGLLERSDTGSCVPCPELMTYYRAHQWSPEAAIQKLAPVFARAWFADVLMPRLRFRPLTEDEAIAMLADAAAAGPEFKLQLKMILEYLETVGLTERENGSIRISRHASDVGMDDVPVSQATPSRSETPERTGREETATASTGIGPDASTGAIRLNLNIHVDMSEIAKWSPDRIGRFMGGLAQVLAAKGEIETES